MADVMNYIDRLVAELCPDGVEYRPLGEIADIGTGKSDKKDAQESGQYPFYVRSKTILRSSKYLYDETAIVIPGEGGVGEIFHFVSGKYDLHQRAYRVSFTVDEMNPKFGYYYISSFFKEYINRHAVEATVKSIRKPMLVKFEVPVPPLEIQEAIVEILDKFTNLEAELEAELEARTLQYEYYRDSLFEALDCPRVPLDSFTQYSKDRKKDDSTVSVYVGVENLKSDFQGCAPTESTNPGVVFQKGDILLGNIRPYLKKMWRADSDGVASPDVLVIRIRDEFSEKISSRYLYHLLASNEFVGYNVAHSRGGKMPRGNKAKILEFEAPIPSLEEQQRIVDILDRFDALTSSLSEGLPAELAARRSQYEYYRDQLLTFPRKGDNQ